MAKKKQELTVEEKLAAALVREDEQPYEVPGNWVWTRLNILYNFIDYRGKTPHKISSGVPLITAKNVKQGYIDYSIAEFISHEEYLTRQTRGISHKGDILFTTEAPLGNVAIADLDEFSAGQRLITLQKYSHSAAINNKFYAFYMLSGTFKKDIDDRKTGTTVAGIKAEKLKLVPVPLPPLTEQQRIVDRIESLFDQLDQAKALIQEALDSFETRKAAILHQAFTGALTKKWREEHGVGLESWEEKPFKECTEFMQNGISKRSGKTGRKVVVLRLANINGNNIDENDLREILLDDKEFDKYKLGYDDILIVRVNGSVDNVGKLVRIVNTGNWAFCDHLIKVRVNYQSILPSFLMYVSMTNEYKDFIKDNMVSSAGQNTISQKSIGELVISLPTLDEQQEIVRILDDLFEKEQDAKDLCDQIDQIDTIKKTILGKAFRGELGTNVAGEESAVELLKEVIDKNI